MIENILKENKNMDINELMKSYLITLETIIPQHLRNNFYKNLKTVKIIHNDKQIKQTKPNAAGYYDIVNNTIYVQGAPIIKEMQKQGIDKKDILDSMNQILLHEFIHMASSSYNKETKELATGFEEKGFETNEGINEGVTELISISIINPKYIVNTEYTTETQIIRQIYTIIGQEKLFESFFSNTKTELLEKHLSLYLPLESAHDLLREIESNYILRNSEHKTDSLYKIQNILLKCLEKKLTALNNQEEIEKLINYYSYSLILPTTNNTKKYTDLDKNQEEFETIIQRHKKNTKTK